ncbi:GGDEF domain-containing protein [Tardiphaga sp. P9-11]|uniref:GGDEF domain-containing protein n=1 Tax=Tardiphaga sp. P9-11 TaxID=2024614 RepID=UPI0011F3B0A8|nr:GGDEF domain-containing protein [Tardiphaga sp. P9-11]KAA0069910.1 GGDEF domain-containing protein [Tardiphaga sp. P9-11]
MAFRSITRSCGVWTSGWRTSHITIPSRLPNRALFLDRLQTECDRPRGGPTFAVLFIDLDGFKAVNDTFGHSAGDELLVTVARRLRSCVGERDLVARLGGDEFAVLQCGISVTAEARDLAASILDAFGEPNGRPGDSLGIEASIGIAVASDAFEDAGRMLRSADDAMYRAKASGCQSAFKFGSDSLLMKFESRLALVS